MLQMGLLDKLVFFLSSQASLLTPLGKYCGRVVYIDYIVVELPYVVSMRMLLVEKSLQHTILCQSNFK